MDKIFSCTQNNSVTISGTKSENLLCSDGKHLYSNGVVSEKICVQGECSVYGRSCPHSAFHDLRQFSVDMECSNLMDLNLEVSGASNTLSPNTLENVVTG